MCCTTVTVITIEEWKRGKQNIKTYFISFWESSWKILFVHSWLPYSVFCLLSESPNQRNQNKQKYLVCISNTASPTPLLTDAVWNKEGTLLAAPRLTANHVTVVSASWPITCLSCSGLPPLLLPLKVPMVVDKLGKTGEERGRGLRKGEQGEELDKVGRTDVFTEWGD